MRGSPYLAALVCSTLALSSACGGDDSSRLILPVVGR